MPAGQDDERTIVGDVRIGVGGNDDAFIGPLRLHDRAGFEKEAGERNGFLERAAAVAPQVDDETVDLFAFQPFQEREHILGRALFVRIHVGVKGRESDPAELGRVAVAVLLDDDVGACFLVFEFNLIAHQLDRLALGGVGRAHGDDEQANLGSLFAADLLDHFVEPHIAHVDEILRALCDRADAIADFQPTAGLGRTAGNEALDFGVAILAPQHRADADERQAHVDAEILQVGRAQIFRVRIVGLGEGIEEEFDLLFVVFLVNVAQHAVVAALDQFWSGLNRVFG